MALGYAQLDAAPSPSRRRARHSALALAAGLLAVLVALVVLVLALSGASLASDPAALARVEVQPLGGRVELVRAFGPGGRSIPVALRRGRLVPLRRLAPGELVTVLVKIRRPGWIGWALGAQTVERLSLRTPVARLTQRWMTLARGGKLRVSFQSPVSAVAVGSEGRLATRKLPAPERSVSLGAQPPTGTLAIAAAARPWETLGASSEVSWFPPARYPVLATLPAASASIAPAAAIYLTFSKPVSAVLGAARPRLTPSVAGRWKEPDSHTLVFTPAGFGAPLGARVSIQLPRAVSVTAGSGGALQSTSTVSWQVPPGSTLRLQQLLAQEGYLPVSWSASAHAVARTPAAEVQAAVSPPSGAFSWRYPNTPAQLQRLWSAGEDNTITRGAVMKFENLNGMIVDGVAGAAVWRRLMDDAIAGRRLGEGYSYVSVQREVPETLTLWHAGQTILRSSANTGIAGAETELGTYPVFEHIPEGTMSGTNPDGSHYEDPGIKWISYFHGGDALHNFDRASFGTPQSLGCVELPLAASAKLWPFTPIGTLVTVEA